MAQDEETKKITEALYEHNLELAVKNKTLSLLEKLYKTSILALTPGVIAKNITDIINEDLNFEFVGIMIFDKESDSLVPLSFSQNERLVEVFNKFDVLPEDTKIVNVSKNSFLKQAIYDQVGNMTNNLSEVWKISAEDLEKVTEESHIKTTLLHPLMSGGDALGVLLLGLNRDYETLNDFEKESIKSFINVIALSLDKAFLYKDLQDANRNLADLIKQRENLVHLVTHKVKGAFTRSKYIFAGMLDGTFGEISSEIRKRAEQGLDSDNMGIETVDLVLNVANMQKGTMKYDMSIFDLKELILKILSEKKASAEEKGLKMEIDIKEGTFHILGDPFWMKEVVHNLIENSIKYTKEGKISMTLERKDKKILFSVKDTGVGITPEDKDLLFTEGGRGKESVNLNVDSTGYGLYSVKLIMDAHQGRVWAESEGAGKGATFFIELDAM